MRSGWGKRQGDAPIGRITETMGVQGCSFRQGLDKVRADRTLCGSRSGGNGCARFKRDERSIPDLESRVSADREPQPAGKCGHPA